MKSATARLASACADASAGSIRLPHSGETGKDNNHTGRSLRPLESSVQSNASPVVNPLILDTPWEQKNEDVFIVWKTSYGRPYVLDDFLLIEAKFGERIQAILDGHGTLPLIIKWACHISKDFRDLKDTGELREEFPHILLKITAYIVAGELTPRMFIERVEKAYLANLTFGNGDPDPMDVLEEEYINECDEHETEMDLMNPWGEDDAKQVQTEFDPWEGASRSEITPDCAVAPLTAEEKQDANLDWNNIEVEDLEVTAKATKASRHNKLTELFARWHECVVPFTVEVGSFQIQ